VVFWQYDDAAGGFGDGLVNAIEQLAHHRAAVHKIRFGGGDAAGTGDHLAQWGANRHGDGDRVGHGARDGQGAVGHRRVVVHRACQVDQRQHIVDRHAHILGQRGRRHPPSGGHPDGDDLVTGRVNVFQDVDAHVAGQQRLHGGNGFNVFGLEGDDAFSCTDCLHGQLQAAHQLICVFDGELLVHLEQRLTFSGVDQVNLGRAHQFDVGRETGAAGADDAGGASFEGNVVHVGVLKGAGSGCRSSSDGLVRGRSSAGFERRARAGSKTERSGRGAYRWARLSGS